MKRRRVRCVALIPWAKRTGGIMNARVQVWGTTAGHPGVVVAISAPAAALNAAHDCSWFQIDVVGFQCSGCKACAHVWLCQQGALLCMQMFFGGISMWVVAHGNKLDNVLKESNLKTVTLMA